jgi:methylenetetrahydrofolate dehydrogenase (NADP+) / methenyltetrahydrofolate cyclohydrolase
MNPKENMQLIDGKLVSNQLKEKIKKEVEEMVLQGAKAPHLAAVLVGNNPASRSYVRSKVKFCEQVGFGSTLLELPETVSESELLAVIDGLNKNPDIDGFIVQLPLPVHIDEEKINLAIDHRKDVDGFHPVNFGRMAQGMPAFLPATPYGILLLLEHYQIPTEGKKAVVLGRSNIVGTPMSILLSRKGYPGNCTVTMAHSRTKDLEAVVKEADLVIAAIGKAGFVRADMVKEGAVVIDVGINRVEDSTVDRGYRLVGDVDFAAVAEKASYLTPVPGGVGLMTVTALIMNTLKAAKKEIYA